MTGFLNPYGFVSIPDRDQLPPELQDEMPPGHDRYDSGRWSGSIPITIITRTPLLLPDHARAATTASGSDGAPPTLPVRVDHDGRPMLSGSAVKGMLRSSFEEITNSRFGVFRGHDTQLAVRATADRNVSDRLKPGMVIDRDKVAGTAVIRWVEGLRHTGDVGGPGPVEVNPAVWVPISMLEASTHRDGDQVEAWIYPVQRMPKPNERPPRTFWVWRAAALGPPGTLSGAPGPVLVNTLAHHGHSAVRVVGRLHRTDSTFPAGGSRKHDERLVVEEILAGNAELSLREAVIGQAMIRAWDAVIDSFVDAHETEPSAHLKRKYGTYVHQPDRWRGLQVGRTVHVEVNVAGEAVALHPAMIGRKPFPGAPVTSLPGDHRPAERLAALSPADRVFGWVRDGADREAVAYRGHLRVDPGEATDRPDSSRVRELPGGRLALTVLNSPKPAQFLFYLGDNAGKPLNGRAKRPENGYPAKSDELRLRGRKVYLTHAEVLDGASDADTYWTPTKPATQLTVGGRGRFQEYVAPQGSPAKVTTTISHWVVPATTFTMTLRVDNLSTSELGALLWLLSLPEDAVLKLGLGKPLGFGAVRVEADWDKVRLYTADMLVDRYRTLTLAPISSPIETVRRLVTDFDALLNQNEGLAKVRTEFLAAARGYHGVPVHYPRAHVHGQPPTPGGDLPTPVTESYKWWVSNDSGRRTALPELSDTAPELPYLEEKAAGGRGGGQGAPRRQDPRQGRGGQGHRTRHPGSQGQRRGDGRTGEGRSDR